MECQEIVCVCACVIVSWVVFVSVLGELRCGRG